METLVQRGIVERVKEETMRSRINQVMFAAITVMGLGMLGSSGAAALPVDSRLAALAASDSNVQQVWYYRRGFVRYGYARPWGYGFARRAYWGPRYYGYAPAYYGYAPAYYSYAPAYYYGAPYYPRYSYWGYGYRPGITISFGFGRRWWW
jgi:hypothetical protein